MVRDRSRVRWVFWSTASGTTSSTRSAPERAFPAAGHALPQLGHARTAAPARPAKAALPAARGRYHLYVSLACPWAHRTVIFRMLKGLEDVVSMSVVEPLYGPHGWTLRQQPRHDPRQRERRERARRDLSAAPTRATPAASACRCCGTRSAAPSSTTNRPRSSACSTAPSAASPTCAPTIIRRRCATRSTASTTLVYENVNNGVYRAGFATSRPPTRRRSARCSPRSTRSSERLARQRYLAGGDITEADWRLFTTLVRFDAVYYGHFKCNLRRIVDYPNLSNYLRDLYQQPGIAATVNMDHIKRHYYGSQRHVNPTGIVPLGPELDFLAPHDRGRFSH